MKFYKTVFLSFLFCLISMNQIFGQIRDMVVGVTEANIAKRTASQENPLWKIPLGPSLVETMEIIGPNRLLVGLKKDFPGLPNLDYLVVDTEKGEILWRHDRKNSEGRYKLFLIFSDMLLFRIEKAKEIELLSIHPESGVEIWRKTFKGKSLLPLPVLSHSQILIASHEKKEAKLTAISIKNGSTQWEKVRKLSEDISYQFPMVHEDRIFLFYEGIEKLSPEDGSTIYTLNSPIIDSYVPTPVFAGDTLLVIGKSHRIYAISNTNGNIIFSQMIPSNNRYTNIVSMGKLLYIRGINELGTQHLLFAFDKGNGSPVWDYSGTEPSVSNLLESDNHLFFGTPQSLVALDKNNGKKVFSAQVTTTGKRFPVHIRQIGEQVIYIGELVVASYDSESGEQIYKRGITPIAPDRNLDGLDYAIPNLRAEMAKYSGKANDNNSFSQIGTNEMIQYQNMSRKYWSDYENAKADGDYLSAELDWQKYQVNQKFAEIQAYANLALSLVDIAVVLRNAMISAKIQTSVEKQVLFRKSILDAYIKSESQNYVYRPHLRYFDADDQYVCLKIIHLPTGKYRDTYLSPQYLNYGFWNLVDFNRGVAYHHGIGMDVSDYQLSKARQYYPYKKVKTIENFLIASPVKIPRNSK